MKKTTLLIVFMGVALISQFSLAQRTAKGRGPYYGMAGCGLGSTVSDTNTGWSQWWLATQLNGVSSNQSLAILTGTSNCGDSPSSLNGSDMYAVGSEFVRMNMAALAKEAAQGVGEHLTAFSELLGCARSATYEFSQSSQKNYNHLFSAPSSEGIVTRYRELIKSDSSLAEKCALVG